jgi:ankyrin repeat protein
MKDIQNDLNRLIFNIPRDRPKEMEEILDMGVDIDIQDSTGKTPLIAYVRKNFISIVHLLVDKGADLDIVDKKGRTALYFACLKGSRCAQYLLEKGANPRIDGVGGSTLLYISSVDRNYNIDIIKLLLEKGVDPYFLSRKQWTRIADTIDNECLSLLLENGVDPNQLLHTGETLLTFASTRADIQMVGTLLSYGANPTLKDGDGATPSSVTRPKVRNFINKWSCSLYRNRDRSDTYMSGTYSDVLIVW